MINKKLNHYEATYNGVIIEEFDNYTEFYNWLMGSDWSVMDFGNDTGIIVIEPITKELLQKLHIKQEVIKMIKLIDRRKDMIRIDISGITDTLNESEVL